MNQNLHKFYYKDYFKDIDFSYLLNDQLKPSANDERKIKENNKLICSENLLFDGIPTPYKDDEMNHFQQEIQYPGLVTGVGIKHETGITGEFKLGVHFDWTYGMPVVYGSSVKGVLRSYFKDFYVPKPGQPNAEDAFEDIFNGRKKSIYERDIFFDAVLVKADKKGRILCPDSITPHDNNPLKNPIPITFLKIAPGCLLKFRFKLVDTKIGDLLLRKEDKEKLFCKILTTVGVGAKTNVGYGQLK